MALAPQHVCVSCSLVFCCVLPLSSSLLRYMPLGLCSAGTALGEHALMACPFLARACALWHCLHLLWVDTVPCLASRTVPPTSILAASERSAASVPLSALS